VGSWSALWEVQQRDGDGNSQRGDVYLDGVSNSLVRAERRIVAAIGVRDLIIVETQDAVLVAHKDHVQRVKQWSSTSRPRSAPSTCTTPGLPAVGPLRGDRRG